MVIGPETQTVVLNLVANLAEIELNSEITIMAGVDVASEGRVQIADEINASIEVLGSVFGITRLMGLTVDLKLVPVVPSALLLPSIYRWV